MNVRTASVAGIAGVMMAVSRAVASGPEQETDAAAASLAIGGNVSN